MKWLTDPPADWDSAPEEPPADRTEHVPLEAEQLANGVIVREPDSSEAYIYASDGDLALDESA